MAAICLLVNHTLNSNPDAISEWALNFHVAHLPATACGYTSWTDGKALRSISESHAPISF